MGATSVYDKRFQPFTMGLVPDEALPPLAPPLEEVVGLTSRQMRMLRLGAVALQEVLKGVEGVAAIPVLLGTAEALPGRADPAGELFLTQLATQAGITFNLQRSKVFPQGRAAGLIALKEGIERIVSGQATQVIVGGVDTYLDLYLLGTLDMEGRILAEGVMDGFVPGEGAGFLLLASDKVLSAEQKPMARVVAVATGVEKGHRYSEEVYRGDGLAGTMQMLFESAPPSSELVRTVYAGFNGENFWAKEWGVAYLRSKDKFDETFRTEHPVDCFGDPGAALGPVTVGLAAIGMQKGYLDGPSLIWCSSDREPRAAALVQGMAN
jgi:3-oxoacyl-[acyl-carrier-protein] synthase-1